ncbi:hypothetical protein [Spirosoma areae]
MIVNFHLVITQNGSVRVLKSKPNLGWDEISMEIKLSVPNEVFKRPQFKAELVIPESAIQSTEITVDFTEAVKDAIQQTTGYEVRLSLVPHEGGVQ